MHRVTSLVCLVSLMLACTPYKPKSFGRPTVTSADAQKAGAGPSAASGSQLVIDHTKLLASPGTYTAKIIYGGGSKSVDFTPTGTETKIPLEGVPAGDTQVLTVEILSGDQLKFIAKKANVALSEKQTANVVIDDCLILKAPWDGKDNDGSCEWTIQESL